MRFRLLIVALSIAGCSLFREPPDHGFLENRDGVLAAPGESYVVLSGGACNGLCPVYEIFVFESGRVVFNGKEHTARSGLVERLTMPSQYFELKKLLSVRRAYSSRSYFGCLTDQPGFDIGAVEGERIRVGYMNYGCRGQREALKEIEEAFVRVSGSADLIK